ncbi:MAG TPA: glycosyltransferase, partial [Candidatus Competibacteraceae bacterium]|nr:glycosyltransferase [Candidatus Competibacteraceae bacterium]
MSEPIKSPAIAILIVNFKRAADTVECLNSLSLIDHPSFDIILADNGSGDAEVAVLQEYAHRHGEHIRLISFPANYGFTGAHNRVFADIIPAKKYEFILLLNNDTVV